MFYGYFDFQNAITTKFYSLANYVYFDFFMIPSLCEKSKINYF